MDQPIQSTNQNLFDLQVDHLVSSNLTEAAKWARFLGVLGMIFCGLILLAGLFAGSLLSMIPMMGGTTGAAASIGAGFITVLYFVIAAIYFFPCLFLYRFGSQLSTALKGNEQTKLQSSFKNLKACFRFMGILCIIMLAFYVLAFLGLLAGSAYF